MKNYEGLFILRADLQQEDLKALCQKIQEVIGKYSGTVENADDRGKRQLAYKIGKHKDGIYYILIIKIDPSQIGPLRSELKLNESIIRLLFTQK